MALGGEEFMKKIAILGSSGGNLYNLGGKEPLKLIGEIEKQASSADIIIGAVQFIGANASMDHVSEKTLSRLYYFDKDEKTVKFSEEKSLKETNEDAKKLDGEIADLINKGEIDGLVLMSCDPNGINKLAIKAAAEKKIPIVGTGGTSMATVQSLSGRVIAPLALMLGDGIRYLINTALSFNSVLAGTIAGLLMWPAIMGGVYHAAILPIVLLEMEKTGSSFLGAIDMTALVMVSAGITLANIIYPKQKSEAAIAGPGFIINVAFGTFVEASYPFMFSDKIVFAGALISGALSGTFVGLFNVKGTAYVPSVTAPFLSTNALGFTICMLIALVSSFLFTIFANRLKRQKKGAL